MVLMWPSKSAGWTPGAPSLRPANSFLGRSRGPAKLLGRQSWAPVSCGDRHRLP